MDNKEPARQENQTARYTISEYLEMMEPIFQQQKTAVEKCIAGLTIHAANLAAKRQEDGIGYRLEQFVREMAEFWDLETADSRVAAFEQAVSEARDSGQAPALTEQGKADVLAGLDLYAQEIRHVDPEMEEWAAGCEVLVEDLEAQWQAAQKNEPAEDIKMGGMT